MKMDKTLEDFFEKERKTGTGMMVKDRMFMRGLQVMKIIKILTKYQLKEIEEQIRIYKDMESTEILDDLPEPLKTKESERYSKLKKDSKTLKEFLKE